jgi:hypothetical protein
VAQKLVTEKYSLDAMIEHHVRLLIDTTGADR